MEPDSIPMASHRSLPTTICSAAICAAAVGLTLGVTATPPVRAHAIESTLDRLTALNNELLLESRFGTGEPANDAVVRLLPPGGQPIELGRTDARGQLRFHLPAGATSSWEVQVDRGPGHRDYLDLPGDRPGAPQGEPATLSQAHRHALAPARGPMGWLLGLSGSAVGAVAGVLALRRQR